MTPNISFPVPNLPNERFLLCDIKLSAGRTSLCGENAASQKQRAAYGDNDDDGGATVSQIQKTDKGTDGPMKKRETTLKIAPPSPSAAPRHRRCVLAPHGNSKLFLRMLLLAATVDIAVNTMITAAAVAVTAATKTAENSRRNTTGKQNTTHKIKLLYLRVTPPRSSSPGSATVASDAIHPTSSIRERGPQGATDAPSTLRYFLYRLIIKHSIVF